MISLLYWACPNVKQPGFPWVTPGGLLAVILWIGASALFALYVSVFASYNKTYGSLGGVIVFLTWLWITNIIILLGAEFNSEMERSKAIQGGHPPEKEPYLPLRDEPKPTRHRSQQPPAVLLAHGDRDLAGLEVIGGAPARVGLLGRLQQVDRRLRGHHAVALASSVADRRAVAVGRRARRR